MSYDRPVAAWFLVRAPMECIVCFELQGVDDIMVKVTYHESSVEFICKECAEAIRECASPPVQEQSE